MKVKIISAILVLTLVPLASMACGFTVDLPRQAKTGPMIKDSVTVADPGSDETRLTLSFGAGDLKLSPGAENLVDGTFTYNVEELKPDIIQEGAKIQIKQGNIEGLPPLNDMKNEWDLQLGNSPMDLVVEAGAYDGEFELGGLSLRSLSVHEGAANVNLSFSEANQTDMSILSYATGASDAKLTGLANANFSTMKFSGGAGNYTLDFSGDLQQSAVVTVDSGFGNMTIIIPNDMDATVTVKSAAVNIDHASGWSQDGQVYTQKGSGPTLTIIVNMAVGNLLIANQSE